VLGQLAVVALNDQRIIVGLRQSLKHCVCLSNVLYRRGMCTLYMLELLDSTACGWHGLPRL
jgi:hypothetical protein